MTELMNCGKTVPFYTLRVSSHIPAIHTFIENTCRFCINPNYTALQFTHTYISKKQWN